MTPDRSIRVAVFGGLRVYVDGAEVDIGPARQRAILALLVAARGDTVTLSQLTQSLWDDEAPASAANQIHRHVGNLRRVLEPELAPRASGAYLEPRGNGYSLNAHLVDSELERFFQLSERSKTAASARDRSDATIAALKLASAPVFAGLPAHLPSLPGVSAVHAEQLALTGAAVDVARSGGAIGELLPGVAAIAAAEPLNERLQANLMRLLQLGGRRSDAIDVFKRARRALADGLGLDPGPELRAAHLEMLDPGMGTDHEHPPNAPHALPPAILGFVNRAEVLPLLRDVTDTAVSGAGSIAVLSGMGGVGKTTLAVHWATSVADQFPEGALYINLHGYDPNRQPLSVEDGLNRLLEQLGTQQAISDPSQRLDRYRREMVGKRVVLLLDNARDAEQVRPFLPNAPGCLTIVTSRNRLAGLLVRDGARSIPLSKWGYEESRALFAARLGTALLPVEGEALDSIIGSCGGLPLALAIAAARFVLTPESSLPELATELSKRSRVLDSLTASEDSDIRATFEWSYRALDPEAARAFRHLAAHPGPHMSLSSIASMTRRTLSQTGRLLDALVSSNMVTEVDSDRVELHDLLRAYADELLDASGERADAERHLIEHFVRSTREAYLTFDRLPMVELQLADPPPESTDHFATQEDAVSWYGRERPALFAVVRRASALDFPRLSALIALDWRPMNKKLDSASDSLGACLVAYEAALATGDRVLIAELSRDMGNRMAVLERFPEAHEFTLRALQLYKETDDPVGEANTYRSLCYTAMYAGDPVGALEYGERSVNAARRSGRADVLALALDEYAVAAGEAGDIDTERRMLLEALEQSRLAGPDFDPSTCLLALAWNECKRADYVAAQRWLTEVREDGHHTFDSRIAVGMESMFARSAMELGQLDEAAAAVIRFDELMARGGSRLLDAYDPASAKEVLDDIESVRAWATSPSTN